MRDLEIVYRAAGMAEAELVKGYLESDGIPVALEYESAGPVYGLTMNGLGEVRLRVPREYVEEARASLARRPVPLEIIERESRRGVDEEADGKPQDRDERANDEPKAL